MKRSKFTDAQIPFVLKRAEEGTAVAEVCRKAGIAEATFYNWRKNYTGLMPFEMNRLQKRTERLRKAAFDLMLDKQILAEAAEGNF